MKLPIQITTRNMSLSDAAKNTIREKAEKLDSFHGNIMSCRVLVEVPHRHQHKGVLYNVRIDMTVPGGELVVKREPHEDLYVSIRDAFDAAKRQLQDFAQRQRGEIKAHEGPPTARVVKLFPDEGYGFLETSDGREIYFHRNSVLNQDFLNLEIGTEVRYMEVPGDQGPQASTVSMVGRS
jgi:ribosomal subunit interface protein